MQADIIKFLADGLMAPLVVLAVIGLVWKVPNRDKFAVYSRMLVAGLTAYLVAKLMALAYQPSIERPFELLGTQPGASYLDNPGFPSDHVLFACVIVWAVWYGTRSFWLSLSVTVLALAIGLGRVLALVHTPLDVLGGIVAASIGALWYVDVWRSGRTPTKLAKK